MIHCPEYNGSFAVRRNDRNGEILMTFLPFVSLFHLVTSPAEQRKLVLCHGSTNTRVEVLPSEYLGYPSAI